MRPSPGGSLGQEQCGCRELPGSLPDVFPNRDPHAYYSESMLDVALGRIVGDGRMESWHY